MTKIHPLSPLTRKANTRLADNFQSSDIITLYKEQLNINVSSFFPGIASIQLFECIDTGYKFYHPKGLDGDSRFYESLQHKLNAGYYHDWKFENELAYNAIQEGDKVLDIGCGIGNFLMKAKNKTSEVYGLELNKMAVNVCHTKGLKVFDELIEQHAENHIEEYDMVCMFQVLEHVSDVQSFILSALKVLKVGGKLLIGVPNNEPYFAGYDKFCTLNLPPHHMGLWNKRVFDKFAPLFGLTINSVKYDKKPRIIASSYLRAKYHAGIKSLPGKHTSREKIKMVFYAIYSFPITLFEKLTGKLHGAHIAVLFTKTKNVVL